MRVAELDMTNSCHQCPSPLQQHTDTNGRTCRIESETADCSLAITYTVQYCSIQKYVAKLKDSRLEVQIISLEM